MSNCPGYSFEDVVNPADSLLDIVKNKILPAQMKSSKLSLFFLILAFLCEMENMLSLLIKQFMLRNSNKSFG